MAYTGTAFTKVELTGKLVGWVTAASVTDDAAQRAHDYAVSMVLSYTSARYGNTIAPTEGVRKQHVLELAFCHVLMERFNEQDRTGEIARERKEDAMVALRALAKGEAITDALSDEKTEQQLKVLGETDEDGNDVEYAFTAEKMGGW